MEAPVASGQAIDAGAAGRCEHGRLPHLPRSAGGDRNVGGTEQVPRHYCASILELVVLRGADVQRRRPKKCGRRQA